MIRVSVPGAGLVRRLRQRAQRLADRHLRQRRRRGHAWRAAATLWPDFVDHDPRS